jgi:hypothetical protein
MSAESAPRHTGEVDLRDLIHRLHTHVDTPDTLDYERMAQVTVGVAGAVARLGQMEKAM